MRGTDLGTTIQILANVGVIAGIVFLVIELQQNNELLATQARYQRAAFLRSENLRYIENPELIRVTVKAQNSEPLTREETFLLERACSLTLDNYSVAYEEYRRGLLEEGSLPSGGSLRYCPDPEAVWNQLRPTYQPEFIQWAEENIIFER